MLRRRVPVVTRGSRSLTWILTSLLLLPSLCLVSAPPAFAQDIIFHVTLSVPGDVEADIRTLFQQSQDYLSTELGFTLTRQVTVFVYGSQREIFDGLVDELGYPEPLARRIAARAPFFAIGQDVFINAGTPLFLDVPRRVDRARIIAHELTHLFHNDLMGSGDVAPSWIKEGFAVRYELLTAEHLGLHPTHETADEYLNLTLYTARRGELIPLTDLEGHDRWQAHVEQTGPDRVYGQAFVAVDHLMHTKGQQALLAYFRAFQASTDAAANFAGAFGLSVEEFQKEFEGYLASLPR